MAPLKEGIITVLSSFVVLEAFGVGIARGHLTGFRTGAPCFLRGSGAGRGRPGRCTRLPECRAAMQDLKRGGRPQLCGFPDGRTLVPNVCCAVEQSVCGARSYQLPPAQSCARLLDRPARAEPSAAYIGPGSAARKACKSYEREACALDPFLLSAVIPSAGEEADKMEFPHMALLGYGEDRENIDFACGGSLISSDFVLTAAHCRALRSRPVRWALLGAVSRTSSRKVESDQQQLIQVVESISHPEYDPRQRYHDIALLRLARPAQLSRTGVRPACLHTEEDGDPTGLEATATGWGATGYAEDVSENLIKVNLTIRSLDVCRDRIKAKADPKLPQGIVDTQLCAGGGSERDTCQGDSGGPLQVASAATHPVCLYRIIGVVSFGPACGIGLPGVYTRVAAYVPWIESVVWPTASNTCSRYDPIAEIAEIAELSDPAAASQPNTGPGTLARRMCRAFLLDWCLTKGPEVMQPGIRKRDQCHYHLKDSPTAHAVDLELYPHMALLAYGDKPHNREVGCTASLIAPQYLLTAAHCASLGCLPVRRAILGLAQGRQELSSSVRSKSVQDIAIAAVIIHPAFDPARRLNDVALLRLERPARITTFSRPACLHTDQDGEEVGLNAIATGWDANGHWQDVSGDLREVVLPIRPAESCDENARKQGFLLDLQPSQLCSGGLCINDTYPGDTGSPLQVLFKILDEFRLYRIVGLVSGNPPCESRLPDVFTRVSAFVPWIESIVWPSEP